MNTHEIPREQWMTFLDDFSRDHSEDWFVTVEVMGGEPSHEVMISDLPFEGISIESRVGQEGIAITAELDGKQVTRNILAPVRLLMMNDETESSDTLMIEDENGIRTLIQTRPGSAALGMGD